MSGVLSPLVAYSFIIKPQFLMTFHSSSSHSYASLLPWMSLVSITPLYTLPENPLSPRIPLRSLMTFICTHVHINMLTLILEARQALHRREYVVLSLEIGSTPLM